MLRVLDAVLRSTVEGEAEGEGAAPVRRQEEWILRAGSGHDYFKEVQDGILPRESLSPWARGALLTFSLQLPTSRPLSQLPSPSVRPSFS